MNRSPRSLDQLQQWMQSVITHPRGVAAAIEDGAARSVIDIDRDALESVIPASRTQTSVERLNVYANAYYARLLECLRDLFPACRNAVGDEIFDDFAFGYLQQYPPRSYTLGRLASCFVEYLDTTRTAQFEDESADDREGDHWCRFLVELAKLESTIDEVFDGPGIEHDPPWQLEELRAISPDAWASVRLVPVVCLRLLEFDFPVNDYFGAFRRGESPELPDPEKTYLAVTRRDYVVRRCPLNEVQHTLLGALVAQLPLGEALAVAAERAGDLPEFSQSIQKWFAVWSRDRLFARIVPLTLGETE